MKDSLVRWNDKPLDEQVLAEYADDGWCLVNEWVEDGEYAYEFERS